MFTIKDIIQGVLFLGGILCFFMGLQGIVGRKKWGIPVICIAVAAVVGLWYVMTHLK